MNAKLALAGLLRSLRSWQCPSFWQDAASVPGMCVRPFKARQHIRNFRRHSRMVRIVGRQPSRAMAQPEENGGRCSTIRIWTSLKNRRVLRTGKSQPRRIASSRREPWSGRLGRNTSRFSPLTRASTAHFPRLHNSVGCRRVDRLRPESPSKPTTIFRCPSMLLGSLISGAEFGRM